MASTGGRDVDEIGTTPNGNRPTSPRTSRTRTSPRANGKQATSLLHGSDLDLEIVTITPGLAQEWLDRGGNNRKVTRRRIEAMTAAIQRGEWQLTGQAIKLDDEGRVRDAQNRLHAIVEAGILRSRGTRGHRHQGLERLTRGKDPADAVLACRRTQGRTVSRSHLISAQ
jgi:hypothetical protein